MSPQIKAELKLLIEKYADELDRDIFDSLVYDCIEKDILDDLLDLLYSIDITIPPEVVNKQLYEFYIKRVVKTEEEQARYMRKINYLINKHQNVIVTTLDAPKS